MSPSAPLLLPPGLNGHDGPLIVTNHEHTPCLTWVNLEELHRTFIATSGLLRLRGQSTQKVPLTLSRRAPPDRNDPCWLHHLWRSPDQGSALIFDWEPRETEVEPLSVRPEEVAASLLLGWVRAGCPGRTQRWALQLMRATHTQGQEKNLLRALALPALSELTFSMPGAPDRTDLVDAPPEFNPGVRQMGFQALRLLISAPPTGWSQARITGRYNTLMCEQTSLALLQAGRSGPLTTAWIMATALSLELNANFPGMKEWVSSAQKAPTPVSNNLSEHLKHNIRHEIWTRSLLSLAQGRSVPEADQQHVRRELSQSRDLRHKFLPAVNLIPPSSAAVLGRAVDSGMHPDLPRPTQADEVRARLWRSAEHPRLVQAGTEAGLWRSSC